MQGAAGEPKYFGLPEIMWTHADFPGQFRRRHSNCDLGR
jgi:hypothetical protein